MGVSGENEIGQNGAQVKHRGQLNP